MVIGFLKKRNVAKIFIKTVFFLSNIARKSRMYFFKGKKISKSSPNRKKKDGNKKSTNSCCNVFLMNKLSDKTRTAPNKLIKSRIL